METLTQYLLVIAGISFGAFFGSLGSKLVSIEYRTNWKWAFYIWGSLVVVGPLIYLLVDKLDGNIIDYITIILSIISGALLIVFTRIKLDKKYIYKSSELDPIINKFTSLADRSEIRLFGGDLNFFGNAPSEMDGNTQYNYLKSLDFKKTLILCEEPRNSATKIRYGKICSELKGVELRFYRPEEADLMIRGRMKTVQGVERLLIYNKMKSATYQTIETDTANSNGALYNNIWKLVWSLATKLSQSQKDEYIKLFRN